MELKDRTLPRKMNKMNDTTIAVLPIGEFNTDLVKKEFDAIIRTFDLSKTNLIVADPISDVKGARLSVKLLSEKDLDLLLLIVLRGLSAETIEAATQASPVPSLILPVQGRYALASSALAVGAMRESKALVELVYAPPDHPDFIRKCQQIARVAKAYSQIRKSRVGVIGGLFPNLVSCRYDSKIISSRLGMTLLPISFEAVRSSFQTIAGRTQEVEKLHQEITSSHNVNTADENALDAGIQLHLALKQIAQEKKLDGFATECWTGFPKELGLNPCMGFIEDAYTIACEGDVMLCTSLLIVRYLTGRSAYVGDLFDMDLDGILILTHCGAPASLSSNQVKVVLGKSQLALERGFDTMTCRPQMDRGPVTVFRFYGMECDKLHLASGELISCEQSPNLTVKVKINGNRWEFLEQCFGNHYLVVAGDIRTEMKLLCKWLGVTIFET
jgi:L-fucose isomerase-like protein